MQPTNHSGVSDKHMNPPLELTVMMYHYVRDPDDAAEGGSGIPGLSVQKFEAQLDELSRQYTFITWADVRAALLEAKSLPPSACLLTFDDGVRDHYFNVFRILHTRGLSGLFFVLARRGSERLILAHKIHFLLARLGLTRLQEAIWENLNSYQRSRFTQAEEKYKLKYAPSSLDGQINLLKAILQRDLSIEVDPLLGILFEVYVGPELAIAHDYYLRPEQIREMSSGGMHFGGHSRSHPWFDWIDAEQRATEIHASANELRQIEPGPWAFAYPYGGLAEDAPHLFEVHGFVAAFTTQTQVRHPNPYFIGRLDGEEILLDGHGHA